jgi:hypothetical protein
MSKVSRQRLWQKKKMETGCCAICGAPRPKELGRLCREHQDQSNVLHAKYYRNRARKRRVST